MVRPFSKTLDDGRRAEGSLKLFGGPRENFKEAACFEDREERSGMQLLKRSRAIPSPQNPLSSPEDGREDVSSPECSRAQGRIYHVYVCREYRNQLVLTSFDMR